VVAVKNVVLLDPAIAALRQRRDTAKGILGERKAHAENPTACAKPASGPRGRDLEMGGRPP